MDRKTRILFINRWRGTIGPNVWLEQVADQCLQKGLAVHVASPWRDAFLDGLAARGAGIHVVDGIEWMPRSFNPLRHASHVWGGLHAAGDLAALARQIGAGAICFNGLNALWLPRAGRLAGVPTGVVMHGTRLAGLGACNRLFFALQSRWVSRYLTVAEISRQMLSVAGVDAEKIDVIPNGVDTERFRPTRAKTAVAKEFGIAAGSPVVGAVTHLEPRKGAHHLVAAMAQVAAAMPAARCVIVGAVTDGQDEPYAQRVREDIHRLGLTERVILAGRRTDIPKVMNAFDLVVHPSQTEACPYSVLEAQACGKAVVGFRVGGMTEVVQDGQTGVLVPPYDEAALAEAMIGLLRDPARCRRLGQAGRRRVEREFNLQVNVQKVVVWLEGLCRGAGLPS